MADKNDHVATNTPFLSTKAYDATKFLAQVVFPSLGTAYATIALLVHLPYGLEVVGVIAAIDTALAGILGLSKSSFQANGGDGTVNAQTGQVELSPEALNKDTIVITNPGASQ